MAALVQSYPQQSSTMTMLQSRPASTASHLQQASQQQHRSSNTRSMYGGNHNGYRGHSSTAPVAPYAFTSTPSLAATNPLGQNPSAHPQLRSENRAVSAPAAVTLSSSAAQQRSSVAVDAANSAPRPEGSSRPLSQVLPSSTLDLSLADPRLAAENAAKPSPDRYRRNHRRVETSTAALASPSTGGSASPSGSGMASVGHLYQHPAQSLSSPALRRENTAPMMSKDDSMLNQSTDQKKHRRRSMSGLGNGDLVHQSEPRLVATPTPLARSYASVVSTPYNPEKRDARPVNVIARPASSHGRNGSDESASSRSVSRPTSSKREESPRRAQAVPQVVPMPRLEAKLVNIPQRGSSDVTKRAANPSPLSKPVSMSPDSPISHNTFAQVASRKEPEAPTLQPAEPKAPESAAARHLAALNKKEGKPDKKPSRLRRAFSFSSASELKKASEPVPPNPKDRAANKLRKEQPVENEEDAREAAIVQQQEASGLGASIYSGQGHFFTGSTDNLSVSSTASSASLMLRKMGKGMKKSTRSLVGLFRPKSVIGAPGALGEPVAPEPSTAQVSMVTVEAEREKVNINLDPHDQIGGGTGFPRLERNSLDAAGSVDNSEPALSFSSTSDVKPRRSIVGSEKERAEVLLAVKKGILKRKGTDSGNSSPIARPADARSPELHVTPPPHPRALDSPHSSAPSTPRSDHSTPVPARGGGHHRRTDSVTIEGEDYFVSVARFAHATSSAATTPTGADGKSLPGTPRNISFSPRIQFHDTWCSGEYDRRGEIATCNRLTPTLAQAIKEELNSFKMEMEVHESSKVYTHFF